MEGAQKDLIGELVLGFRTCLVQVRKLVVSLCLHLFLHAKSFIMSAAVALGLASEPPIQFQETQAYGGVLPFTAASAQTFQGCATDLVVQRDLSVGGTLYAAAGLVNPTLTNPTLASGSWFELSPAMHVWPQLTVGSLGGVNPASLGKASAYLQQINPVGGAHPCIAMGVLASAGANDPPVDGNPGDLWLNSSSGTGIVGLNCNTVLTSGVVMVGSNMMGGTQTQGTGVYTPGPLVLCAPPPAGSGLANQGVQIGAPGITVNQTLDTANDVSGCHGATAGNGATLTSPSFQLALTISGAIRATTTAFTALVTAIPAALCPAYATVLVTYVPNGSANTYQATAYVPAQGQIQINGIFTNGAGAPTALGGAGAYVVNLQVRIIE